MAEMTKESVSLPAELSAAAKIAAEREDRSFSSLVTKALREWLERSGYAVPFEADPVADAVREAREAGVDVVAVLARAARRKGAAA